MWLEIFDYYFSQNIIPNTFIETLKKSDNIQNCKIEFQGFIS